MKILREKLKKFEQDFQDSSELISEISDIQNKINDLKNKN